MDLPQIANFPGYRHEALELERTPGPQMLLCQGDIGKAHCCLFVAHTHFSILLKFGPRRARNILLLTQAVGRNMFSHLVLYANNATFPTKHEP